VDFDCDNVIVSGDFNLTFKDTETKNRERTDQEKNIVRAVEVHRERADLRDTWEARHEFTWRRANTDSFSTIDRILYSFESLQLISAQVSWAYGFSDHAAVIVEAKWSLEGRSARSRLTRLDPSLAKHPIYGPQIVRKVEVMMRGAPPDWDPCKTLEFLKVAIRSTVEKLQAERKSKEKTEEEMINEELDSALECLAKGNSRDGLVEYIEDIRIRKAILIEEKGTRLAEKLGTKWYNEGEKSNRYFMRLLKRSMPDDFAAITTDDGTIITDQKDIENEIVTFYKNLYENEYEIENDQEVCDDFLKYINPVSDMTENEVVAPIGTEELRKTLHTCKDSAPGPDIIPYSIIGLLWSTYAPILLSAWAYSLEKGELPPSHKNSYLKLIPKAGKDLIKLTNWRPITLSNCDHKLITKVYANRMTEKLADKLKERQTAYV